MTFDVSTLPLGLVVLVGLVGAVWINRRRRGRGALARAQLEQQLELLDIWLMLCAMAAIGAATWAAAQRHYPSGVGYGLPSASSPALSMRSKMFEGGQTIPTRYL